MTRRSIVRSVSKLSRGKLQKQLQDLRTEFEVHKKKLQAIALKTREDVLTLEQRTVTSWEYFWGLVDLLKDEGKLDFLSVESIEKFKELASQRLRKEALEYAKSNLTPGQGICVQCHFVSGGPNFYKDGAPKCPNCGEENSVFLKETKIEDPPVEVAS